MQNTMPEKGFFGHEIFLVDLNKVFFPFFRFSVFERLMH